MNKKIVSVVSTFLLITIILLGILVYYRSQKVYKEVKVEDLEIIYPRSTIPVIKKKGEIFEVKLNVSSKVKVLNVTLTSSNSSFRLLIEDSSYRNFLSLFLRIPENSSIGLFNLTVWVKYKENEIKYVQPRAVQVISSFPEDFFFVHITDVHIGKNEETKNFLREQLRK